MLGSRISPGRTTIVALVSLVAAVGLLAAPLTASAVVAPDSGEASGGTSVTLRGIEFVEISAGENHTLGLTSEGAVYAWGSNSYGQLGDNTSGTDRLTPKQVMGVGGTGFLTDVTGIAAGISHSLALTPNGVFAWGQNANGQLGDGTSGTNRLTPMLSANFQPFAATFAGVAATQLSNTNNIWTATTPAGDEGTAEILATASLFGGTTAATPVILGTFTTNNSDGFTTTVIIPRSTPAGNHHIVFVNAVTEDDLFSTAITVASVATDPQTSPGVNELSSTGVNVHEPLFQGVMPLFLGFGVILLSRRLARGSN